MNKSVLFPVALLIIAVLILGGCTATITTTNINPTTKLVASTSEETQTTTIAATPTTGATPTTTTPPPTHPLQFTFDENRKVWFDYIQFLDKDSKVIQSINFESSDQQFLGNGWSGPEYWDTYWYYGVKGYVCSCLDTASLKIDIPAEAHFLKIRAGCVGKNGYLDIITQSTEFKDLMADTLLMKTYKDGNLVDSRVELHTRLQIHYVNLTPELDSDGDGVIDMDDDNPRIPPPQPVKSDLNIAVYYLNSWNQETDLRSEDLSLGTTFQPILGKYRCDDPDIADWHIKWAVEHGINIFVDCALGELTGRGEQNFENGFLRAKYLPYIKYFTSLCNQWWWPGHPGADDPITMDTLTKNAVSYLSRNYFTQPQYMKIGDRPIVHTALTAAYHNILGSGNFTSFINAIRESGTENGYNVYVMGDIMETWHVYNEFMTEQVDGVTAYCVSDAGAPYQLNAQGQWISVGPYDTMVTGYFNECDYWSRLAKLFTKGFIPPLALGMTNRMMYDMGIDDWLSDRTEPSLESFIDMCEGIKPYIDPEVNMVVIYAWNEFHEGSVLEPTVEYGFAYLDALRDVFCEEPAGGYPPNVAPQE